MAPAKYKSFFTDDELTTLRRAFDLACADLGLGPADIAPREHLSALLFQIAQSGGPPDSATLRFLAVERFRMPAGCRDEIGPSVPPPPATDDAQPRSRPSGR